MSIERLSIEQRRQILEDLRRIIDARRKEQLVSLRLQRLRDHRPPSHWEQVDIDHLASEAAALVGGEPSDWREAAESYMGIPSKIEVCIEVVREVAEAARAEEQQRQGERPRFRMNVGRRKRGGR